MTSPARRTRRRYASTWRRRGSTCRCESVDILSGQNRTPEFLAKNPLGGLPVLELDDGSHLTESLAIIEYLEELHPEPSMIGTHAARARARARGRAHLRARRARQRRHDLPEHASVLRPAREAVARGGRQRARPRLQNALKVIDGRLATQKFVAGETPDDRRLHAAGRARLRRLRRHRDRPRARRTSTAGTRSSSSGRAPRHDAALDRAHHAGSGAGIGVGISAAAPGRAPSQRHVVVVFAGEVVADTHARAARARRPASRRSTTSRPRTTAAPASARPPHESFCEFKGVARYFDIAVGERVARAGGVVLPEPGATLRRARGLHGDLSGPRRRVLRRRRARRGRRTAASTEGGSRATSPGPSRAVRARTAGDLPSREDPGRRGGHSQTGRTSMEPYVSGMRRRAQASASSMEAQSMT